MLEFMLQLLVAISLEEYVDLTMLFKIESFEDEIPRLLELKEVIGENMIVVELRSYLHKIDAVDSLLNVIYSFDLALGLFKSQVK